MAKVALASSEDIEARLGRPPAPDEEDRIDGLLDEASALILGWLGRPDTDWPDPESAPVAVVLVASRMVARALSMSDGAVGQTTTSSTAGPFAVSYGYSADATSGGVWLTRQDRVSLRPYALRGRAGNVLTSKW